ncbi:MFS transporter [Azorhizobium oxalatiphilum]|uniref:MFS transporter n=1 Tax=Azorhizobium oxalatiphilum TaxID=980631 RepID=A0A917BMS3_9HYPH|nr:MFS transporter [Azorhizobium oxalatiphilum]GGF50025.1 MFS transporter [Azorhizobium oxalatiphilum]
MHTAAPRLPSTWRVVPALGVMEIFAWGTSYYLPAVLAEPIRADTGWPLPWIVGALSLGMLVAGIAAPRIGLMIGRGNGRAMLAAGCGLMALGLALIGAAGWLPMFVIGWLVIGLGMGACLYDAAFAALTHIYGASARPIITRLTLWGGFASPICWPISAFLEALLGWRGTCFTYAGVMLLLCLPLVLFALPPGARRPEPTLAGAAAERVAVAGRERATFLLYAVIMTIGGATASTMSVHLLTLLQARGFSLAEAVTVAAVVGPAQVASRLIEMAGRGRHDALWTLGAAVAMMAAGLALLIAGWLWAGVPLALYGAGTGVYSIARGTVPLRLFGPARYAQIIGRVARPNLVAQALAPSLAAFAVARQGPDMMLDMLLGITCLNVLVFAVLVRVVGRERPAA